MKFFSGVQVPKVTIELLIDLMRQDKKNRDGEINFALLNSIGKYKIDCKVADEVVVTSGGAKFHFTDTCIGLANRKSPLKVTTLEEANWQNFVPSL